MKNKKPEHGSSDEPINIADSPIKKKTKKDSKTEKTVAPKKTAVGKEKKEDNKQSKISFSAKTTSKVN